ncbi:N-6 DNA methylase [Methylobacterium variabile]|uniref:N-6 DNA methylase n=1 Tax=Methylobacterium variabile TaxID=298794 RepID=UPI0009F8E678|nr:N-6 DNA methylase [Methylobacterium variabile]
MPFISAMQENGQDRSRHFDPLARFYTKQHVADLLVKLMNGTPPKRIVDVGAGAGTLSVAAGGKWRGAELCTIDLDQDCVVDLKCNISGLGFSRHTHVTIDALDVDLPKQILRGRAGFDAAVSNPPYLQPQWRPGFEQILSEARLDNVFSAISDVTLDAIFISQLLRLTRSGANVGIIVPDGVITGQKSQKLRRAIIENYEIKCVVQLPRCSFAKTDAQAYIMVLRKTAPVKKQINLLNYTLENGLSRPLNISLDAGVERLDYAFYTVDQLLGRRDSHVSLSDINAEIVRGRLSSAEAKAVNYKVFHTSDFPPVPGGPVRLPPLTSSCDTGSKPDVLATAGDILLARVDRQLHRKVGLVIEGAAPITDCIYRIRLPQTMRTAVLSALSSDEGRNLLYSAARGVSARMLSKHDLLHLPLLSAKA